MATEHASISDPNIHEPKGVSTANAGEVYVGNGTASGAMKANCTGYAISIRIPDVSTADTVYAPVPFAGKITRIMSSIDAAITGADAGLTFTIGGVAITDSAITVTQSGSAAGDVDSSTPSAANTVAAGDYISCITDGASSTASVCDIVLFIDAGLV